MKPRVHIRGGCVLTLGARTPNFSEADVLIESGRIAEVAPRVRARDADVVDATDTIVMPGFVDTHRHAWKSLFRNVGEGASASTLAPHHQPEDVYAATLIGLLGAVEAGITTVVDWADIPNGAGHVEAALQAHADAGLRTVFVHAPHGGSEGDEDPAVGRRLASGGTDIQDGLTTVAYGSRDGAITDPDRTADVWKIARELGMRIHAHAGPEERGTIAELGRRGLLGDDLTLVHCTGLGDEDLDAVASAGVALSLTPTSEMASGLGSPPVQALIDRNIRFGLGIDDERIAPGDLFAQMRAAISLQHATLFELKLAGKGGVPNLLTTRDVIRYGTVDGARVAGFGGITGCLEPGKQADIVVLRTDRPNVFPINDPIGAVVWGMDTSNVDWVFAGGRALMRDGALEADVTEVRKLATAAQNRVVGAAGLPAGSTAGGAG